MRAVKKNPVTSIVNSFFIDSPLPANITYMWNFGSLLGATLILQIATGIFLAMHYVPNTGLAFSSVEHIMRDVNNGWIIRYAHANGASMFFILIYLHIARGLYFGSYTKPRVMLWSVGVIILILLVVIAFLGYVLPWGLLILLFSPTWESFNETYKKRRGAGKQNTSSEGLPSFNNPKTPSHKKIGPHDHYIYDFITGSLLGDGYGEKRNLATRIHIHMGSPNVEYLMAIHKFLSYYGYCSNLKPKMNTYIAKSNKVYFSFKLRTYSYTSFSPIYDLFYPLAEDGTNKKVIPKTIKSLLSPLVLAIWIMDDGGKSGSGLRVSTQSFAPEDVKTLSDAINSVFGLSSTLQAQYKTYNIYFPKKDLGRLKVLVEPHFVPSMLYKFN